MHISVFRTVMFFATCFALLPVATANPITWSLAASAPGLTPGVGGTFTYDAATNQMLNWNIHQCMLMDCGTLTADPNPACPTCTNLFSSSTSDGQFLYTFTTGDFVHTPQQSQVTLAFATPLSDMGGTVPLIPGTSDGAGSIYRIGNGTIWTVYPFADGTVESTPEPGYGLVFVPLVLGMVLIGRSRR